MNKLFLTFASCLVLATGTWCQVTVNADGSPAHPSAALDIKFSDKGFLLPRMTFDQRNAIASPAEGLMVFCTNCGLNGTGMVTLYTDCRWIGAVNTIPCTAPCGQPFTDCRDGKTYNTVLIGTQCWMAKNLNFGTRVNGNINQADNSIPEKYCYNDLESNCNAYGGLYQWAEFMNYTSSSASNPSGRQGLCPEGWHIPSDAERCQLETFLDNTVNCSSLDWNGTDAGGKLKESGLTHWSSPNAGATNSSGFTGLPGGYRSAAGTFATLTFAALMWTSTEENSSTAWDRNLSNITAQVGRYNHEKILGFSGRCIRD